MPQVRRLQREVSTAPLPGVRRTAGETALSRGAGVAAAQGEAAVGSARALADLGAGVANVGGRMFQRSEAIRRQEAEQARQYANEIAVLNASNQLDDWELGTLHDPEHGALTVTGKAAFDLPERVDQSFKDVTGKIEQGLSTDEQRLAFAKLKANRHANVTMNVQRHVAGEMHQYDVAEHNASVNNRQSLASANALDPPRVDREIRSGVEEIRTFGARTGMGPAATQARVDAFLTNTHIGVIRNLLANEKDTAAGLYFEHMKGEIAGDKQDEILAAIKNQQESGSVRREGQQQADAILAAGGTLTQQREKARGIDDPKVRDDVMGRLEHEAAVKDKTDRDADEARSRGVYDLLDRTNDWTTIPATVWSAMSGAERSAAKSYVRQKVETGGIKTDMGTLYDLITLSSTSPDAFLKTNITAFADRLSPADLEQAMRMQASLRTGDRKAAAGILTSEKRQGEIVDQALLSLRLVGTPGELAKPENKPLADKIVLFRRAVRDASAHQEAVTQKPVTDADLQSIVDRLIAPNGSVMSKHGWFSDTYDPSYVFETDSARRRAADIPLELKTQIDDALRRKGKPVDDAHRVQVYEDWKRGR